MNEIARRITSTTNQLPHLQHDPVALQAQVNELKRLAELIAIHKQQGQTSETTDAMFEMLKPKHNQQQQQQQLTPSQLPPFIHAPFYYLLMALQQPSDTNEHYLEKVVHQLMHRCDRKTVLQSTINEMCKSCVECALPEFWNHLQHELHQQILLTLHKAKELKTAEDQEAIMQLTKHCCERLSRIHMTLFKTEPHKLSGIIYAKYINEAMLIVVQLINAVEVRRL